MNSNEKKDFQILNRVKHCNFGIGCVSIQDYFKILNIDSQNIQNLN
jgi:hypothetical protein